MNYKQSLLTIIATGIILSCGIQATDTNIEIRTIDRMLFEAQREGSVRRVKALILFGANVDSQDNNGNTPLSNAWYNKNPEMTQCLAKNTKNIDAQDYEGNTALHNAVNYNNKTAVEILLKNNANPNIRNDDEETPLHKTIGAKQDLSTKIKIIYLLLNKGADINAQNGKGETLLHNAAIYWDYSIMDCLIDSGADQTIKDTNGESALDIIKRKQEEAKRRGTIWGSIRECLTKPIFNP